MKIHLRQHLTTSLAVALGVMIGSVGPGVAQAAYDAVNADKVDGKHAVGSGATVDARKGKLVATSPTTGLLPNNLIAKALDSSKLNGYPHQSLRFLSLPVQAVDVYGAATQSYESVNLSGSSYGLMNIGFLVPPDHKAGEHLYMDVLFRDQSGNPCSMYLAVGGTSGPGASGFTNGGWFVPPSGDYDGLLALPGGLPYGWLRTFEWPFQSNPGDLVSFKVQREPSNVGDTCGDVSVSGLQLRY
jgi:hypothetical protein